MNGKLAEFGKLAHIWWGVSVEDRQYGLPRIEHLRTAPAAVRFLSVEPLLGDLGQVSLRGIHWAIVGGESGHGARPMNAAWVRSLRDQCQRAEVPFFFKQWGGVIKSRAGRELDGKTWDEMPGKTSVEPPDRRRVEELLVIGRKLEEQWMRERGRRATRRGGSVSATL